MNYKTYLEQLALFNVNNINLGLGPISDFLQRIGNPHNDYPSLLIGGTNGKGSISAMLSSILVQAGFRTGLYTSPHLVDVRERIRLNGEMISPEDMSALVYELKSQITQELTYFEFITAVAFAYFKKMKVDIAVLEVGMGGRLDATNVVVPLVSVISNVAMDHMEYLGDTPAKIAREKGGIIKSGGICLTASKDPAVLGVLAEICQEKGARLKRLGKEIRLIRHRDGTFSCLVDQGLKIRRVKSALIGRHQEENAALAVATIGELKARGFAVHPDVIRSGLDAVRWEGRLELISKKPPILLDGAHNPDGAKILCRALKEKFSFRKLIMVFGVLADKDFRSMIRILARMADVFIITRPDSSRAVSPDSLAPLARRYCKEVLIRENAGEAFSFSLLCAEADDLIVIAGSLYLIGQAKKILPTLPIGLMGDRP